MPIVVETLDNGTARLGIGSGMTIYEAAGLKADLLRAVAEHPELDIDLSEVAELDTAGLQLLVLAKREAVKAGHVLRLSGHSGPVREVLGLYRMESYFGDPVVLPAD
ncbi:STAS domain-containing protein [Methylomagnum ishizawai]|uniref:STAS domain-containing protein n=1 Tax=Methylomagnum ishizawai TaxID=1760988 RepID=UPI001C325B9D|nr:STAS domain-containing protein [Methylomagnum ishizawai]BBL74881.1 hypothetical protein MishRS11D_19790 [Methylomagnum ishizawai]